MKLQVYTTVAQMLHEENYLQDKHAIQISTCHRFISICFNTREKLLIYCDSLHQILPDIYVKFEPDQYKKIRISIENILIKLPDK